MDTDFEYFEKYIIKQIVNTVNYNPEMDKYEINRIHITDDIIRTIESEGLRYGLQKQQVAQIISTVSDGIKSQPSTQLRYDSIDVKEIKFGQHVRINVSHPNKGEHYVEMLKTGIYRFFILASDIMGIEYGDELQALDKMWNNSYYIDFKVYRNKKRKPDNNSFLRLGTVSSVELYNPSIINEILDSESQFTYNDVKQDQKLTSNKDITKDYYFWTPNKWEPITFCWKEGDIQNDMSPFIIIDKEGEQDNKIIINKNFVLSHEIEHLDAFMSILFDCCKWKNMFLGLEYLKYIKTIKAGNVRKCKSELGCKEWTLKNEPQIKFIYEL